MSSRSVSGLASGLEIGLGLLVEKSADMLLQDGERLARIGSELGGDLSGDARRPVRQGVAVLARQIEHPGFDLAAIDEAAL